MPDVQTPAAPARPRGRLRPWALAGVLLVAAGGGLGWYLTRPRPPQPPAMMTADGADPAVVAAVETARQKVLAEPKSAASWGELGMVFGAHGFDPEADRCMAEAERLDPADPRWPYLRGLAAAVRDPEQAAPLLERALERKPKDPEALVVIRLRLAEVLLDRRRPDEAEAQFRDALGRSPENPRAGFGLAQLALARGDRGAARDLLRPLADNPFTRKRAAILLAALAREDGDLAAAARHSDEARRLADDPPWPDPYLRQLRMREVGRQGLLREAETLEAAGQLPRAAEMLADLARADPTPRLLVTAGIALGKLREYVQAEAMFRECLRRDPGHAQANYFLAVMLFQQAEQTGAGRPQAVAQLREASGYAARAVELKPDHGLAWLYLGRIRSALGDTRGAVEALRQAVACRPEYAESHLYLAETLAAEGKADEAVRSARNAEQLAGPGDARARQLLDQIRRKADLPKK